MDMPLIKRFILIDSARGSIVMAKMRGDRGQPCHVPLVMEKGSDNIPLARTLADGVVYRALIADNIFP